MAPGAGTKRPRAPSRSRQPRTPRPPPHFHLEGCAKTARGHATWCTSHRLRGMIVRP
ncbi:hypothetical protein HMPREF9057_00749 [Actinomyces sp. oral taxon 171 str. F0337]|nr:hypothetical protein HMPREF9057_00749 [Actinomyces sp. oral taxon 171 str. F0337]